MPNISFHPIVFEYYPGLSFDLTGSYQPANYCGSVMWLLSAALYLAVYFLKNRRNRLLYSPVDAQTRTADVTKDVEENASLASVHAHVGISEIELIRQSESGKGTMETYIERTEVTSAQDLHVIVDKVATL